MPSFHLSDKWAISNISPMVTIFFNLFTLGWPISGSAHMSFFTPMSSTNSLGFKAPDALEKKHRTISGT